MITLAAAATLVLALTSGANAADRVPQHLVGPWCADAKTKQEEVGTTYRRAAKCNAHEPEEVLTISPDRMLISDIANCKFLEITSVTRHGTHRLKFWCKSQYESYVFDAWFSVPGRDRIVVQIVEEEKKE
jgi:hypothetical protein